VQVTRRKVVPVVLAQHITQAVLGLVTLEAPPDLSQRTLGGEIVRFLCAMVVLDAWQFAFHRLFHEVDWLYKHVHVWHHKMYVPFAYGGLYQHPFEMLIMDTLSGLVSVSAVGAFCMLCTHTPCFFTANTVRCSFMGAASKRLCMGLQLTAYRSIAAKQAH
jgi:sterol desaturase/sphingolipid hydroxylase (fatty acid hydroxylase superfamily)